MSDIDEYRTIHEILGEEKRWGNEDEKFKNDVERLMRVLYIQSHPSTTKESSTNIFDTIATNIIDVSNSNFDNKSYLSSSLEEIYSYVLSSDLTWDDLFARLLGVALDIIKMSNMKIYNPMGSYFNQQLRIANFTSLRTKECIEQYAEYNLLEEARWLAIEIYKQYWNISTFPPQSNQIESHTELLELNNAHNQEMKEWCTSNRKPTNQSEFDIRKYINCFKMEFARQDEEAAEIIVLSQKRLEAYKEEARRKTEQQRTLAQRLRAEEKERLLKEQKTLPPPQIETTSNPKNKWGKSYAICGIIAFVLGVLYLVGIGDMDYGYYQFLRVISFIAIPIFIYVFWKIEKSDGSLDTALVYIPSVSVWLLFNPIFPIYMSKESWIIVDLLCAIAFFVIDIFLIFLHRNNK